MPSSNPKKNLADLLKVFNEYTIQFCREDIDWEKNHISFPAFLTAFTDTYTVNWSNDAWAHRDNQVQTFQNTQRKISIGFTVLSSSLTEAKKNLEKISKLIKFQYRARSELSDKGLPPFMLVRFLNFITSYNKPLKCTIGEVSFNPTLDSGFFIDKKMLYAKEYKISLNLIITNDNDSYWDDSGAARRWAHRDEKYGFPYLAGPEKPDSPPSGGSTDNKPPDSVNKSPLDDEEKKSLKGAFGG